MTHGKLETRLRARVRGSVRFDTVSRLLYSTDASMYQILPIAVVVPLDEQDVAATVEVCAATATPIIARGGGTGLGGQCLGRAVILDFSQHMRGLLSVDADAGTARVQPGIVLDELNRQLARTGLMFAPDVAPSNRATVGGMIANNSCGAHSILFGKTIDHTRALRGFLSDGTPLDTESSAPRMAELRGAVRRIVAREAEEIDRRFPKILRRVGGYNLDAIGPGEPPDLAKLLVGSEGTLAVVTEATIGLVPRPRVRGLMAIEFADLLSSLEATLAILTTRPAAVEVVDRFILDLAAAQPELSAKRSRVLSNPAVTPPAQLLVEYFADSREELRGKLAVLESLIQRERIGTWHKPLIDPAEQADAWAIRKAGVGILQGMIGDRKPQTFVEDCGVAPERLPEFTRRFYQIVHRHGTDSAAYAHASAGLLHFRPVLSLKSAADRATMRAIAVETVELALEFGGAISGEHGDGLVRSCWNRRMFGDRLYAAFREVKRTFDPGGLLNPGKIVDAPDMLENLRYGPSYPPIGFEPVMDFGKWGGLLGLVELCNGNGACRKMGGQMCPSFQATREESDSTRGRANALRAALTGQLPDGTGPMPGLASDELAEVLDLCIECKGCQTECPSNVDLARLKSEVLHHRHRVHGVPWRSWLFAHVERLNQLGCATAPLSNWLANSAPVKWLNHRLLGVNPRRALPPFAEQTLCAWFAERPRRDFGDGPVWLLADCFAEYNHPEIGRAAVRVLERVGAAVRLAPRVCCGRPMISKGLLDHAQRQAELLVSVLGTRLPRDGKLVVLEPSCLSVFRDELPALVRGESARAAARRLAAAAVSLEEFLLRRDLPAAASAGQYLVHGHCHQKAMGGLPATMEVLGRVLGRERVGLIESGCCGMAGSFGFEVEHDAVSRQIGELALLPAVRAAPTDTVIVAAGTSCRQQISDGVGRRALHPAEALAAAYATENQEFAKPAH